MNTEQWFKAAKEFGLPLAILIALSMALWQANQSAISLREQDLQNSREELVREREFIRGELKDLVNRNTEAFRELKEELARQR